jgi:glycosyltransferase involved in cell wall biosynthesis
MGKTKVLQLVEGFNFGGAESKLLELVQHMDRTRFETMVMSLGLGNEIEDQFQKLDCRVITYYRQKRVDLDLLKRLREFIHEEKIDIVMTTLFYADVLGALAGHKGGAKGVFSWETISSPKWLVPHRLYAYRYAIRKVDKVISVSQATADWLVQKRKVPPQKITIIPYGVNLEKFKPGPGEITRSDIGIETDDVVIGQVSRLTEQKGHTYLIDAAKLVVRQFPRVKFVLAGDGPLRNQLEAQIRQNGLQDHFILLGFRRDVPELLRLFDIFALPSLYEGLPNVVLEAMATALPVVATPVDGTKEAVADGETGLLVPEKDSGRLAKALLSLLQNNEKRIRMGQNARQRVENHFSLKLQVEQFERLYSFYANGNGKKSISV